MQSQSILSAMKDRCLPPILSHTQACIHLEQAGIIPTQQRVAVVRVLLARPQHLSAEQLTEQVHQHGYRVSKATVYNTLRVLVRANLVREVLIDPTRVFYDSNLKPHAHCYHEDSGELSDLANDQLSLQYLPVLPSNLELVGIDVVLRVRGKTSLSST